MTLGQIIAPVAAAAVVNIVLLGLAWRATQIEKATGRAPWYLGAGILTYCAGYGAFLYAYRGQSIATPLELFGASLGAQVLGAAVIFLAAQAWMRTESIPVQQRVLEIGGSLFLLFILFGSLLSV